jgi:hypothetical protein
MIVLVLGMYFLGVRKGMFREKCDTTFNLWSLVCAPLAFRSVQRFRLSAVFRKQTEVNKLGGKRGGEESECV